MIFQENDFLKTYNEVDKLWEGQESEVEAEDDLDWAEGISFQKIIQAAAQVESNLEFWRKFKQFIRRKYKRKNQKYAIWYLRFLNAFLKPYLAEHVMCDKLKAMESFEVVGSEGMRLVFKINEVIFEDTRRNLIYPDEFLDDSKKTSRKIAPDYKVTGTVQAESTGKPRSEQFQFNIECKSAKHNHSSLHEAPFVLIYDIPAFSTGSGTYRLEVTDYFEKALPEDLKYIAHNTHASSFSVRIPGKPEINKADWESYSLLHLFEVDMTLSELLKHLQQIHQDLKIGLDDPDKKMVNILGTQTNNLIQSTNDLNAAAGISKIKPKAYKNASPEAAANDLQAAAETLAKTVLTVL
jgi:hypothetical protein